MVTLDINKLQKLAKLARIEIPAEEQKLMLDLLNNEIDSIKNVQNVNTDGLESLTSPVEMNLRGYKDEVSDGNKQEELMKCSNKSLYNYYAVPKIIEN